MEVGVDVKRDNGTDAADENNVPAQEKKEQKKQTPASVLTLEAREQTEAENHGEKTRLLSKDKGFPQKDEQLLKRHHVGAELGRQRGRKAFSPGGGNNKKKFKTSRITLQICLFYLGTSCSKRVVQIVLIYGNDFLCSVLKKKTKQNKTKRYN